MNTQKETMETKLTFLHRLAPAVNKTKCRLFPLLPAQVKPTLIVRRCVDCNPTSETQSKPVNLPALTVLRVEELDAAVLWSQCSLTIDDAARKQIPTRN
jgi:hypothetical protein